MTKFEEHSMATPLPPQTLIIGTRRSVTELSLLLALADPDAPLVGALLYSGSSQDQIGDIPVLGGLGDLEQMIEQHEVQCVLVSLPVVLMSQLRHVIATLAGHGVLWRFMPTLSDQLEGRIVNPITEFALSGSQGIQSSAAAGWFNPDVLLDRPPAQLHEELIARMIKGQVVMITGAGGSIGSELARQVARFGPATLVLAERNENALFVIQQQIKQLYPNLQCVSQLHDVVNAARTVSLVDKHRPHLIFHTAAHKHVPLMESHPWDAVANNYFGTRSVADAAHAAEVPRFVQISTDKAVNPTSIMGAAKRLAELYVQDLNVRSKTTCCTVRFGNVLGSAGSVVLTWMNQLAKGAAITVTHPEMTRYFMTIGEGAGLVMQSAAMAEQEEQSAGPLFVLDMGKPIRILDLARRFLISQGLEPDIDVPIKITEVRPGEKLTEQLAYDHEDAQATAHPSIHRLRTAPPEPQIIKTLLETFDTLRDDVIAHDHDPSIIDRKQLVAALKKVIPELSDQPDVAPSDVSNSISTS